MTTTRQLCALFVLALTAVASCFAAEPVSISSSGVRFEIWPEDGHYQIDDRRGDTIWRSNPFQPRFGEITLTLDGKQQKLSLTACKVKEANDTLIATFQPLRDNPQLVVHVTVRPSGKREFEFSYRAEPAVSIESIRLLDDALSVTRADTGYVVVPVREGMLIPADSKLTFTHRFDTFAYEGCHMEMFGLVKNGAAALVSWHDPYIALELKSQMTNKVDTATQVLSPSLILRKTAKSFRVQFLGKGDYVAIADAYRPIAEKKGWRVTWDKKLKEYPERAKLFGAINFKLWSTLTRTMNEDSTQEVSSRVNWTFDEAAQIAEHLKKDLKLDKVFFLMGGWIHRGYDNQHPDILPTAPECGGDAAFSNACQRIRQLGYLVGLHDNYQDMYRDAPSWDESYLMKNADGKPARGGKWAGGYAWLTCSQKAVELAKRPQNLPAVKKLSQADAYFIDTTYAAGLMECFDPKHPLTRWDDMKWKQAISDYGREVFGIFGSECGREWAIPHSDFFEGLTGVSGGFYHDANLTTKLGATVIPLFELVYRDCIAMYGKYGYDPARSAEYVLHHISIARPLNYHSIPSHLYWKEETDVAVPLAVTPSVLDFKQTGPRQFSITYRWQVQKTPPADYHIFVHFTDPAGKIKFQGDHLPKSGTGSWKPGDVQQGPFTVSIPEGLTGPFDVRIGLFQTMSSPRALFPGINDSERRCNLGKLQVADQKITFEPKQLPPVSGAGDLALFLKSDNGWTDGLHRLDRFVKNTYEILSPLNEITSEMLMTEHQFLTPDNKVQRSVFGKGRSAVEVVVNLASTEYRHRCKTGGEVVLPAYGFCVDSRYFAAFHATSWNGHQYTEPTLFTLRSLDEKPISSSKKVRVYHAFGDPQVKIEKNVVNVPKETVITRN